jgi:hypothetical protein
LYWAKLAILLFYEEEVSSVWAFGFTDGALLQVFFNEFMTFHYFFLGEREQPSRQC